LSNSRRLPGQAQRPDDRHHHFDLLSRHVDQPDNVRLATRTGSSLNLSWNLKRICAGRHKVTILARDRAGNASRRSVTVRVVR